MKVIRPGHRYELEGFESNLANQQIQFIEKVPTTEGDQLVTRYDGTTNEEVLKMLINRMNYLQGKFSCRENEIVITKLQEGLMWLEKRTEDREKRNVEGKQLA